MRWAILSTSFMGARISLDNFMILKKTNIVIVFDNVERPDTTGIYFKRALENLGYHVDHYNSNCYLTDSIPDTYDLHLCIDDGFDYKKPMRKYKKGIMAFYAIDTHLTFEDKFKKARLYDIVFCAQKDGSEKMSAKNIKSFWIPLGFDKDVHKKYETKKIYDIAFVGNIKIMKERAILEKRYRGIYKAFIGKAPHHELSKIYSQSKIILNWPIKNDINMRFFEALGSGSFLLSKKVNNGENLIAKRGIHYAIFSNWIDLDIKILYYLLNYKKRERIAKQGYDLAMAHFTYTNRANEMVEIISKYKQP